MKLLACSDVHGRLEAAEILASKASEEGFNIILVAGDLTHFGPAELGRKVVETLLKSGLPVLHVPGNIDPPGLHEALKDVGVSLHGRGVEVEGLKIVGAGYEDGVSQPLRRGIAELGKPPDIVLTHVPPYGSKVDVAWSGEHVGSVELADFLREFKPRLSICGHIHEARGVDQLNGTLICNPGPAFKGFYAEVLFEERVEVSLEKFEF